MVRIFLFALNVCPLHSIQLTTSTVKMMQPQNVFQNDKT